MIRKWKVTPMASRPQKHVTYADEQRSKDDAAATNHSSTTQTVEVRPRKPRRHTTGNTKENQEDLLIAKHFNAEMIQNDGKVINELGQEIDPNSTLGRKQLIGMLKQRYGQDIENYRSSIPAGDKERMKRERQLERDRRHEQRMKHGLHDDDVDHRYIKVTSTSNGHIRRSSGGSAASATSDGSDGSAFTSSPPVRRTITKSATTVHTSSRYHSSDDEQGSEYKYRSPAKQTPEQRKAPAKEVVFLQYWDEMRRVNLPSSTSSMDAIKVLFINAFPGKISMPDFENDDKSIYIKDLETGVYFQLDDVSDVMNRSFLKIHEKHASQHEDTVSNDGHQQNLEYHSFSETECHNLEKYHSSKQNSSYAESLQDFDLTAPRMRRTNSGSSLRSDNVLNRPTYMQNSATSSYSYIGEDGNNRIQPHNEGGPTSSSNSSATKVTTTTVHMSPTSPRKKIHSDRSMSDSSSSVQDQLDDLTDLLKSALKDEERHHHETLAQFDYGDAKNPGKLNQNFIEDLQIKMESSAKKNQCLPKHFQPTVIVKAQQEAHHRSTPPYEGRPNGHFDQRKSSSEDSSHGFSPRADDQPPKLKSSASVRVTVRSKANKPAEVKKTRDDMSLNQKPPQVTEDFFTPPNKQAYVEHKSVTTTTHTVTNNVKPHVHATGSVSVPAHATASASIPAHTSAPISKPAHAPAPTVDFDMSELDDLMNYDPSSQQKQKKSNVVSKDTTEVASDLLDQLQDLENEMKIGFSSVDESLQNSRRSSNSSAASKSSGMYATVNKHVTFSNNEAVKETPRAQNIRPHPNTINHNEHADAEAEIAKLRSISFTAGTNTNSPRTAPNQHQQPIARSNTAAHHAHLTSPALDQTDNVFTFTRSSTSSSSSQNSPTKTKPTRQICERASVTTPDFMELEVAASRVRTSIHDLRKDLNTLRKMHVDNTRHFKNDIQKKLLEFRKKANKVDDLLQSKIDQNNNSIFANDHPVREQRHRLTGDQSEYNKKVTTTEYRLQTLEGSMENVRLDVVQKKRVENPEKLIQFEDEIVNITRSLTDVRNKFLGINDMLQRVMKLETEIIEKEGGPDDENKHFRNILLNEITLLDSFLKEEPHKLDSLINRCKTLSATLETLRKLAKMQHEVANRNEQPQSIFSPDYQEIEDFSVNKGRGRYR